MNRADLLSTALDAVNARPKAYGPPEDNFNRIARHWNVYMTGKYGCEPVLDAVDIAAMMALMKIARLEETPDHMDSWTDLAGYAACGAEVAHATIEHDPDERIKEPPPRFKVGDRVRIVGCSDQGVCTIASVQPDSDRGLYAITYPDGFTGGDIWWDDELEPA